MTSDSSPVENVAATSDQTRPLPFDTSKAHQARVYDYVLGGKDNITRVVSGNPYSASRIPV